MTAPHPEWESDCLLIDPFDGDYGGSCDGDGVLSDKLVTARKRGECHACAGPIVPGRRARRRTEVYDGSLKRFSWCEPCCRAMGDLEDPEKYERRIEIGIKRRGADAEPGTDAARAAGCTCTVRRDWHDGDEIVKRDEWCALHGRDPNHELQKLRDREIEG